jgi:hypothetical protein
MKYIKLFESMMWERLYHGNRKGDFPPKRKRFGAIFLTSNLNFAKNFAGYDERDIFPNGAVFEVELKPGIRIMDMMDTKSWEEIGIEKILFDMIDDKYVDPVNGSKFLPVRGSGLLGYDPKTGSEFQIQNEKDSIYHYLWRIKHGAWRIIECAPISDKIEELGYDGYYVVEGSSKNVAIFKEDPIMNFKKLEI